MTVDGILLTKAGTMTGDTNGGMEASSHKWDDKKIKNSLKLVATYDHRRICPHIGPLIPIVLETPGVHCRSLYLFWGSEAAIHIMMKKKSMEEKRSKLMVEYGNIKKEIGYIEPQLLKIKKNIDSRQRKLLSLEKRMNQIVDKIYKRSGESVGVENIREYEENQLAAAQELADERLSLRNQQSKLKYQLEYEKKRDMGARIAKLESSQEKLKKALVEVDEREKELTKESLLAYAIVWNPHSSSNI